MLWKNRAAFSREVKAPVLTQYGTAVILSDVRNALLFVDDIPKGYLKKGGKSVSLVVGKHKIFLRTDDWTSSVQTIEITGKETEPPMFEINRRRSTSRSGRATAFREWLPGRDPD